MISALLIDNDAEHAERMRDSLVQRGLAVSHVFDFGQAIEMLREKPRKCEIVMLVIADIARPWATVLSRLQDASLQGEINGLPLFLCVSKCDFGVDFELQIERMGARYVHEE